VGGGGPVGVQDGDAPAGGGVPRGGGGQAAGVVVVDQPEPGDLAEQTVVAFQSAGWDGDVDQRRDARAPSLCGGVALAAGVRVGRGGAGVPFLQQV